MRGELHKETVPYDGSGIVPPYILERLKHVALNEPDIPDEEIAHTIVDAEAGQLIERIQQGGDTLGDAAQEDIRRTMAKVATRVHQLGGIGNEGEHNE